MDLLPLGDLRSELTLLCRWLLQELSGESDITRVMENEGDQFPELIERMREQVVQAGYKQAAEYVRRRLPATEVDPEAIAAIFVGAAINYRRTEWTFGAAPLRLDEDRFVEACVETIARFTEFATAESS